jgi:hypothetical protein
MEDQALSNKILKLGEGDKERFQVSGFRGQMTGDFEFGSVNAEFGMRGAGT